MMTESEFLQVKCDTANKAPGNLHLTDGYFCPRCHNKGQVYKPVNGDMVASLCSCLPLRRVIRLANQSGIAAELERKTFATFSVTEPWQAELYRKAQEFITSTNPIFFISGQSGCGKTHLCTAICNEMIRAGRTTVYLDWISVSKKLKATVNSDRYSEIIEQYLNTEVLYIDDFLKVKAGSEPTSADISLAFEILNSRLYQRGKRTIISTEHLLGTLMELDEATASRIYEGAGAFALEVNRDRHKNVRIKG